MLSESKYAVIQRIVHQIVHQKYSKSYKNFTICMWNVLQARLGTNVWCVLILTITWQNTLLFVNYLFISFNRHFILFFMRFDVYPHHFICNISCNFYWLIFKHISFYFSSFLNCVRLDFIFASFFLFQPNNNV